MSKTHSSNKASQESHKQIEVYTDGSALGNPGAGTGGLCSIANGVAVCAPLIRFASHAASGAEATSKPTFKPDHSSGADQKS